jgi:glutaredoxin 2
MLGVDLQEVIVNYDDKHTLIDLVGIKTVPILVKDNGTVMFESSDIMAYFMSLTESEEANNSSGITINWQRQGFPLLQTIGYPRWYKLKHIGEFSNEESRQLWVNKKQTEQLNFERLLEQTPLIVPQVNALIKDAEINLQLNDNQSSIPLLEQAIYFSILRGLCSEKSITWPINLITWLESQSDVLGIPLLR